MTSKKIQVYFHPTCKSSYTLIKSLHNAGLLGKVELIDTSKKPLKAPWSVPWIKVNGQPAATDPVSPEEVEALIKGEPLTPPDKPVDAFMEAVLYSAHASAQVVLHDKLDPVLDAEFAMAVLRRPGDLEHALELVSTLKDRKEELYAGWKTKIAKALSLSFIRELAWTLGGSVSPEQLVSHAKPEILGLWVIGKASIGRAGLPWRPGLPPSVSEMAGFIVRGAKRLAKRLNEEIETIYSDREYWAILDSTLSGGGS